MLKISDYEFWFVAGSQFLYGEEQLKSVAKDAQDIVDKLNASGNLPYPIVFKGVMTTAEGITQFMKDAHLLASQKLDSRYTSAPKAAAAPGYAISEQYSI